MSDWVKQEPTICCLQEIHFKAKDIHRLKVRGWKKIFHTNTNGKKVGVTISDKIYFKTKSTKKDKEGHYIVIKRSIEEDITFVNIYAPNIDALKCVYI